MLSPSPICRTVYPRWRGEHAQVFRLLSGYHGLSPLARGTLALAILFKPFTRFIPAGAGNTSHRKPGSTKTAVYPRWRGEHLTARRSRTSQPGLSPLARGTRQRSLMRRLTFRFIPAGAGNTASSRISSPPISVYPRWRGEHDLEAKKPGAYAGLSPLARGTLVMYVSPEPPRRFIPAGAGNTNPRNLSPVPPAVYPRWRGEHDAAIGEDSGLNGLSPLARGTPIPVPSAISLRRFIPAGAGNTTLTIRPQISRPVYPRWRGEHETTAATLILHAGLSPLARGTRSWRRRMWR